MKTVDTLLLIVLVLLIINLLMMLMIAKRGIAGGVEIIPEEKAEPESKGKEALQGCAG